MPYRDDTRSFIGDLRDQVYTGAQKNIAQLYTDAADTIEHLLNRNEELQAIEVDTDKLVRLCAMVVALGEPAPALELARELLVCALDIEQFVEDAGH